MSKSPETPIRVLNPTDLPDPKWVEKIEEIVRVQLLPDSVETGNYKDLQVEVALHKNGWPEKLTVHVTYADRYFFESREIYLDSNGNVLEGAG